MQAELQWEKRALNDRPTEAGFQRLEAAVATALLVDMVCLCIVVCLCAVVCLRGCSPAHQLLCALCLLSDHRRHVFHSNDSFYRFLLVPHFSFYRLYDLRISLVVVGIQKSELLCPPFCSFEPTVHKIKHLFKFYGFFFVYNFFIITNLIHKLH
jgi:hypothetical protein